MRIYKIFSILCTRCLNSKDIVNHACYVANNLLKGDFKQVAFTQVEELLAQSAQIIDVRVRESSETRRGMLTKCNISLSEIRTRLSEFDKISLYMCIVKHGERSYNVVLMLQQHGYNAYNIASGYNYDLNI